MHPPLPPLLSLRHQQLSRRPRAATHKEAQPMATNNTVNRAAVTNFSMATNRIWRGQDGESQKQTDWHRVTAWGRLAEVVNQYMGKGKRVRVIGRLEYQTWIDKETGALRSRAVIVASQVLFLDYDRAHTGLAEEPEAEEQAIEAVSQAA